MPGRVDLKAAGPIGETDIGALLVKEIGPAVGYYCQRLGFALITRQGTTSRLRRDDVEIGLAVNTRDPEQTNCWYSVAEVPRHLAGIRRERDRDRDRAGDDRRGGVRGQALSRLLRKGGLRRLLLLRLFPLNRMRSRVPWKTSGS